MSATIAGVITNAARCLNELGRRMRMSLGVDDELVAAVASMTGAHVEDTVFVKDNETPYVIRSAEATVGKVTVKAQAHARPATALEVEAAGGWHENQVQYRAGHLRTGSK